MSSFDDKWLSSFDAKFVPLAGLRNWFVEVFKCPLCMAFLTASVNAENDATVCIGLFFGGKLLVSVDDVDVGLYKEDDDKVFGWSDKCFIWENGDQRLGASTDKPGAKKI